MNILRYPEETHLRSIIVHRQASRESRKRPGLLIFDHPSVGAAGFQA